MTELGSSLCPWQWHTSYLAHITTSLSTGAQQPGSPSCRVRKGEVRALATMELPQGTAPSYSRPFPMPRAAPTGLPWAFLLFQATWHVHD